MSNKLEQLKQYTEVVADTGDLEAIVAFQPQDATTNPSLLLKAAAIPAYRPLVEDAIANSGLSKNQSQETLNLCADILATRIAYEITQKVPGRVSIEVDSRLSFDTQATLQRARKLIALLAEQGVSKDRVLIKIASTWEGIQAARVLEQEGIQCNLTLLFGFAQAVACADAGVYLISPFVGRILDWYKADTGRDDYTADDDPGVLSVKRIFAYYKQHGYKTIVMGASFRNTGEIEALAGCDKLTISPALLKELEEDTGELPQQLDAQGNFENESKVIQNESQFRWAMNEDAMATEKLAEGIRNFTADQLKLERLLLNLVKGCE